MEILKSIFSLDSSLLVSVSNCKHCGQDHQDLPAHSHDMPDRQCYYVICPVLPQHLLYFKRVHSEEPDRQHKGQTRQVEWFKAA